MNSGTLYLVSTPIGNLEDITARALRVLGEVAFVVCEDTRRSGLLLEHFGIRVEKVSLPAFAEGDRADRILERLVAGESAALITDAGTPAISDPGELLVREAIERGISVVPVPGPAALLAALAASGLPTARFHFLGFLPRKGEARQAVLDEVAGLRATLVLYESPRRLGDTLADLAGAWGPRAACVARELTKIHEEWVRGSLPQLAERYTSEDALGEVVVVVEGRQEERRWTQEEVRQALQAGQARGERMKDTAAAISKVSGWSSREVYALAIHG
jgi:16S rRNA (cytidine1402-2'-O)-methyltransferase